MSPKTLLVRTMILVMALAAFFVSTDAAFAQTHDSTDNYLRIECPQNVPLVAGTIVNVPVYMANSKDLGAFTFGFKYDTYHMEFTSLVGAQEIIDLGGQFRSTPRDTAANTFLTGWFTFDPTMPIPVHAPGAATEGLIMTLRFTVKASVVDGCADLLNVFIPPAGVAIFAPNDGSEAITPRLVDCGTADIVFGAGCPQNLPPVVSDIPDQTIAEPASFATITLDNFVADGDHADNLLTWTAVRQSGSTDITVAVEPTTRVATISYTGDQAAGNISAVFRFTATDPAAATGFNDATFTVNWVNDVPIVSDIPDQTISEPASFATITLDNFVADADNADNVITWTAVRQSGSTDITAAVNPTTRVATISYTGDQAAGNISAVFRFTATDPGTASAFNDATFTVNWVNDTPVVSDVPDQTISEPASFATISLDDFVADVDHADNLITWTAIRQSGSTDISAAVNPTTRVATISYVGDQAAGNISAVFRFTATDPGTATGFNDATFTVNWVNDEPVVADIPNQIIDQGGTFATIALDDYVTDVDNSDAEITWTTQLMKARADLTISIDPATRIATIVATPDYSGSAVFTFRATDPDGAFDEDQATFTVNALVNDPPTVSDIPDQTITTGQLFTTINLDDFVVDPDDNDNLLTWTFSGNTSLIVTISPSRCRHNLLSGRIPWRRNDHLYSNRPRCLV